MAKVQKSADSRSNLAMNQKDKVWRNVSAAVVRLLTDENTMLPEHSQEFVSFPYIRASDRVTIHPL